MGGNGGGGSKTWGGISSPPPVTHTLPLLHVHWQIQNNFSQGGAGGCSVECLVHFELKRERERENKVLTFLQLMNQTFCSLPHLPKNLKFADSNNYYFMFYYSGMDLFWNRQLRARRALLQLKGVPLRTRRALLLAIAPF